MNVARGRDWNGWFKIRHFYADLIEMTMHTAHALIIAKKRRVYLWLVANQSRPEWRKMIFFIGTPYELIHEIIDTKRFWYHSMQPIKDSFYAELNNEMKSIH